MTSSNHNEIAQAIKQALYDTIKANKSLNYFIERFESEIQLDEDI